VQVRGVHTTAQGRERAETATKGYVGLWSCVIGAVIYRIEEIVILMRPVASCYFFLVLLAATTAVRSFLLKKIFLAIYRNSVKHQ
jgi:hypothetical protein